MQTPAPVDYARAHSVEEALEMLERYGPESRLIAGGHSLIPMMRLRIAQPERVIDINDLTDLDYIRSVGDNGSSHLAIGAMTRHRSVLSSELIAPITSTGASIAPSRSSAASSAVATASEPAPPASAALAAGTAPWP